MPLGIGPLLKDLLRPPLFEVAYAPDLIFQVQFQDSGSGTCHRRALESYVSACEFKMHANNNNQCTNDYRG